jgi:hypothetical protein
MRDEVDLKLGIGIAVMLMAGGNIDPYDWSNSDGGTGENGDSGSDDDFLAVVIGFSETSGTFAFPLPILYILFLLALTPGLSPTTCSLLFVLGGTLRTVK